MRTVKLTGWAGLLVAVAGVLGLAPQAQAITYTATFPSSSSSWFSATNGSGTGVPTFYMWTTGDDITETFTGTGLSTVNGLTYSFNVTNDLGGGSNEVIDIMINSTLVDSATIFDSGYSNLPVNVSNTVSFSPITGGGTYTLSVILSNTIPDGNGSINFPDQGTFNLSSTGAAVPEPASVSLIGLSLLGIGYLVYRRREATAPIA